MTVKTDAQRNVVTGAHSLTLHKDMFPTMCYIMPYINALTVSVVIPLTAGLKR